MSPLLQSRLGKFRDSGSANYRKWPMSAIQTYFRRNQGESFVVHANHLPFTPPSNVPASARWRNRSAKRVTP